MMKTLLLLLVGTIATQATEDRSYVYEVHAWDEMDFTGESRVFHEGVPYLDAYRFDDVMESVEVTGVWIFYEQSEFNGYREGAMHYAFGVNHQEILPYTLKNKVTSLRYAGSHLVMNENGYNLYEGVDFTKRGMYETRNIDDMSAFHQEVLSIIIFGTDSWTFYEEKLYKGKHMCLKANEHFENYSDRLDVGFYPDVRLSPQGLTKVQSIKRGCY